MITHVEVKICGYFHAWPDDVDIAVVGPGNSSAQTVDLMTDVGGGVAMGSPVDYTFDDGAGVLDDDGPASPTGTYRPTRGTDCDGITCTTNFDGGAPAPGPPHGTALEALNGIDPNGTWRLYVYDDNDHNVIGAMSIDGITPNAGIIGAGWALRITTRQPGGGGGSGGGFPTLTVIRVGAGTGSVNSFGVVTTSGTKPSSAGADPAIHCPPTCSQQVPTGTIFHLHATPATGSSFAGWFSGLVGCGGTADCGVQVIEDTLVVARFEPSGAPPPPTTGNDLSLVAADPASAQVGSPVTFHLTGSNAGPGDEPGATVAGTISGAFTTPARSISTAGDCIITGATFTCDLGAIAPGASASADLVLWPTRGGPLSIQGVVSGTGSDADATNDSASATADVAVVCTINGTPQDDVLTGTAGIDVLCGGSGHDVIDGSGGDDIVRGGRGPDRLMGGSGDDLLLGASGADRFSGGPGVDQCDATAAEESQDCEGPPTT